MSEGYPPLARPAISSPIGGGGGGGLEEPTLLELKKKTPKKYAKKTFCGS